MGLIAYGTKTALYSCSRHITHKSGIKRSFLTPSDKPSAFSTEKESQIMVTIETGIANINIIEP